MDLMNTLSTGSQAGGFLTDIVNAGKGILNLFGVGTGKRRAAKAAKQQFEYDKQLQELAIQQQKEANLELADYSFDKEVEMWNKQNEYNSPAQQMARYKQAGLNPALMYGQGTAGNATSLPSYQTPQVSKPEYSNPVENEMKYLAMYNNIAFQRAQVDNIRAQTRKIDIETKDLLPTQIELAKTQIDKLSAEERQVLQNIDHQSKLFEYEAKARDLSNQFLKGQIDFQEVATQLNRQNIELTKKQEDLIGSQIANLKSQSALNDIIRSRETYLNNFMLPLLVQAKEEELKKLRFDNKLDEKSYKAQLNALHHQSNLLGVKWQISQEELENWQDFDAPSNPYYSLAGDFIGSFTRIFVRGMKKGFQSSTTVRPNSSGGKTIITQGSR